MHAWDSLKGIGAVSVYPELLAYAITGGDGLLSSYEVAKSKSLKAIKWERKASAVGSSSALLVPAAILEEKEIDRWLGRTP